MRRWRSVHRKAREKRERRYKFVSIVMDGRGRSFVHHFTMSRQSWIKQQKQARYRDCQGPFFKDLKPRRGALDHVGDP